MEEIVSAYLRAAPEECVSCLRTWNALALLSSNSLASLDAQANAGDFSAILRLASNIDGRFGDELIKTAFVRLIEDDPTKAFQYLQSVPSYFREEFATKLALAWGERSGADACRAFTHCGGLLNCRIQFRAAVNGWSKHDPKGAFNYLLSLDPAEFNIQDFTQAYFTQNGKSIAKDPAVAIQMLNSYSEMAGPASEPAVTGIFHNIAFDDPKNALRYADEIKGVVGHNAALGTIATVNLFIDPQTSIDIASQMPVSEKSLAILRRGVAKVAADSADPYSMAELQSNPYQRAAAVAGVTQGLYESRGATGVASVVERGLSSNEPEWLDAAARLVLESKGQTREKSGNTKASGWSSLPQEVSDALANYAERNLPPEKAASLKAKLQQ